MIASGLHKLPLAPFGGNACRPLLTQCPLHNRRSPLHAGSGLPESQLGIWRENDQRADRNSFLILHLVDAFSHMIAANCPGRFDDLNGEKFEVLPPWSSRHPTGLSRRCSSLPSSTSCTIRPMAGRSLTSTSMLVHRCWWVSGSRLHCSSSMGIDRRHAQRSGSTARIDLSLACALNLVGVHLLH